MRVFFHQDKGVKIMCNKVQAQGQDHKFSLGLSDGSQGQLSVQWPSGHFELLLPGLARERGLLSCWSILVLRDRAGQSGTLGGESFSLHLWGPASGSWPPS